METGVKGFIAFLGVASVFAVGFSVGRTYWYDEVRAEIYRSPRVSAGAFDVVCSVPSCRQCPKIVIEGVE